MCHWLTRECLFGNIFCLCWWSWQRTRFDGSFHRNRGLNLSSAPQKRSWQRQSIDSTLSVTNKDKQLAFATTPLLSTDGVANPGRPGGEEPGHATGHGKAPVNNEHRVKQGRSKEQTLGQWAHSRAFGSSSRFHFLNIWNLFSRWKIKPSQKKHLISKEEYLGSFMSFKLACHIEGPIIIDPFFNVATFQRPIYLSTLVWLFAFRIQTRTYLRTMLCTYSRIMMSSAAYQKSFSLYFYALHFYWQISSTISNFVKKYRGKKGEYGLGVGSSKA